MKPSVKKNVSRVFLSISLIFLVSSIVAQNSQAEQVLTIAQGVGPRTLDPHGTTTQADLNISTAICEPLILFDYSKMGFVPNLATSWKALSDTSLEIKLRKGVKFTNGEPFDANSAKYSIERIKDPKVKAPGRRWVRTVKEIKVVDSHTIHILFTAPTPPMLLYLTRLGMVPPRYIEEKGLVEFVKKPVGTGPFELERWIKDEFVELKANKAYWKGKAKIDRVIFKAIPETITRMAALKTGEADLVTHILIEEIPSIEKRENLEVVEIPSLRTMFIQFNMIKDSPLRDKRVRQAMNYAVDVDSIVKNILQGHGIKLDGQVLSKEYGGYNPNIRAYPHDPEKARQLMKAAGYENYEFTLNAPTGRYLRGKEVAEAVVGQLNDAGIKTRIKVMEWGAFRGTFMSKKALHMGFWGIASPVANAVLYFGAVVNPGGFYSMYTNPEFKPTYGKAAKSLDEDERRKLLRELVAMTHDDPPFIYLYQQMSLYGVSTRVGGWKPSPDEWIDIYSMFLK